MDSNFIATILSYLENLSNLASAVHDNTAVIAARVTAAEAGEQAAAGLARAHVSIRTLIDNNPEPASALARQLTDAVSRYIQQVQAVIKEFDSKHLPHLTREADNAWVEFHQQASNCVEQFVRDVTVNKSWTELFAIGSNAALLTDVGQGVTGVLRFVDALKEVANVVAADETVVAAGVAVKDNIRQNMDSIIRSFEGFATNLIADPMAAANLVGACARFVDPKTAVSYYLRNSSNLAPALHLNPAFIAASVTAADAGEQAAVSLALAHISIRTLIDNNPEFASQLAHHLRNALDLYEYQVKVAIAGRDSKPVTQLAREVVDASAKFYQHACYDLPWQGFAAIGSNAALLPDVEEGVTDVLRFVDALKEVANVVAADKTVVAAGVAVKDNIRQNMDRIIRSFEGFATNLIADPMAAANIVGACARFVDPKTSSEEQGFTGMLRFPEPSAPEPSDSEPSDSEASAPQAAAPRQNSYRTMTAYGLWAASGVAAAAGAAYLYLYNRP